MNEKEAQLLAVRIRTEVEPGTQITIETDVLPGTYYVHVVQPFHYVIRGLEQWEDRKKELVKYHYLAE